MNARIPVLAAALGLLLASLGGCSGAEPTAVPLDVLVAQEESFHRQRVRTSGTVREFEPPHHVWIEDAALNRVQLEPAERLAGKVGQEVSVSGRFHHAGDRGRRIEVETVEVH